MIVQNHISLKEFNTFGFESTASYFASVTSECELVEAVVYAREKDLKLLPLGGGSNILVPAAVENALVMHINIPGIETKKAGSEIELVLGAGESWHDTVEWTVNHGLSGIEAMALIPGQVGAAPVQNIGAYGTELKDVLKSVRAYDTKENQFVELSNNECHFSYRDSLFKRNPGRYLITSVCLLLSSSSELSEVKYGGLNQYLQDQGITHPKLQDIFNSVCALRRSKLPDPIEIGNAGSFFKNPIISGSHLQTLKEKWPNLVAYPEGESHHKLAAGWLIDQCGWKGQKFGNVGVYSKQALVLINCGDGSLVELMELAEHIKKSVYQNFSVHLEIEPQLFA